MHQEREMHCTSDVVQQSRASVKAPKLSEPALNWRTLHNCSSCAAQLLSSDLRFFIYTLQLTPEATHSFNCNSWF